MPDRTSVSLNPKAEDRLILGLVMCLGVLSFVIALAYHNIADGDLWARLVIGSSAFHTHSVPARDFLAYTPVHPDWIDHEWGAGLIFYALVHAWGPTSLMVLKIFSALSVVLIAASFAYRRCGKTWVVPALLAIPCATAILPGYIPVIRSHAITYLFFAATIALLETVRADRKWPLAVLPVIMMLWANVHGGFVSGLGIIAIYTLYAMITGTQSRNMLIVSLACLAVTCINPHGISRWASLLSAITHPRPSIVEWHALPLWGMDLFIGFRLSFILALACLAAGWRGMAKKHDMLTLGLLVLTAVLGWQHRRHAPFFGITALMFIGPYAQAAGSGLAKRFSERARAITVAIVFCLLASWISARFLPRASFQVLAPRGFYPVREVDILSRAGLNGNVAVPFRLGSYVAWRLYPGVKISMDARYEAVFPESSFEQNQDFFRKTGDNWDRLLSRHPTDFIIIEKKYSALTHQDLTSRGYVLIWDDAASALYAKEMHAARLIAVAKSLPDETIDPLSRDWTAGWKDKILAAKKTQPW